LADGADAASLFLLGAAMIPELDAVELRVLGCLVEKQVTTPEYYPLSLNAVTNACNQKNNREPVVQYDEVTVQKALDSLRTKGLATVLTGAGIRAPKYRHYLKEKTDLSDAQIAVLTELILRGAETPGEVRSRAERLYPFDNLQEVEKLLQEFCEGESPLAMRLPRLAGQKEQRYMHLLGGTPDLSAWNQAALPVVDDENRVPALEEKVTALEKEVGDLKRAFAEWKAQFE
jgi:uncharacterized protein